MRRIFAFALIALAALSCTDKAAKRLKEDILGDPLMDKVAGMSLDLASTGFNAGSSYAETWIRDFNTFIELSMEVMPHDVVKETLNVFWGFQGPEGDIIDGFVPTEDAGVDYAYRFSGHYPSYQAHKNTVETDQESSMVQAVYKFVIRSGDSGYLTEDSFGMKVIERLEFALDYLRNCKWNEKYGLVVGATTADWGDVQPEHSWGVEIDENTHYAIDIYDNAMFVLAIKDYLELCRLCGVDGNAAKWEALCGTLSDNIRKYLWDSEKQKFIPHIYLNGSPFPDDFDENELYYHGGTAIAIEAGLLTRDEIAESNARMLENVKKSGAPSIGLTIYPPYPEGFFQNDGMYPYGYQNGGDWTWFGGRMIQALVANGFVREAYDEIQPMLRRVVDNNSFHEWYQVDGKAVGSGTFRGEAGVLFKAIEMLREWAESE